MKRNIGLFLCCIGLTMFAFSNIVCFDDHEITIALPEAILSLCCIFRASSRLFYPVYYLITLTAIVLFYNGLKKIFRMLQMEKLERAGVCVALSCFILLHIIDLSPALMSKHAEMERLSTADTIFSPEWSDLSAYEEIFFATQYKVGQRLLLVLAGNNGLRSNARDINTYCVSFGAADVFIKQQIARVDQGDMQSDTVYVTNNPEEFSLWQKLYKDQADFYTWSHPENYASNWPSDMMLMLPHTDKMQ